MSIELRAPQVGDAAAIASVFERFGLAYGVEEHEWTSDIENWFAAPNANLERDARIAVLDGELVGYGDVSDAARDGRFVYLDLRVDPAHREDAEPLLLDFLEQRARDLAKSGGTIKAWAPEKAERLRRLIESHGYAFDRYSFMMAIELDSNVAASVWPPGISVRTFRRDEDTEAVYEAHQEAFSDEPDHFRDPFDEWQHWSFRKPFDPELWFLAFEGEKLAGISLCRPEHGGDSNLGWVQILGVRRPWRRRGLGLALLRHSFAEQQARGMKRVGLGVDGANADALRLYEKAGMSTERCSAWYRKSA